MQGISSGFVAKMTSPSLLQVSQQPLSNTPLGRYCIYGALALIAVGLTRYFYRNITSPLRDVPGPLLARFTRLWEVYAIRKYDNTALNIALHEKYGKTTKVPSDIMQSRLSAGQ